MGKRTKIWLVIAVLLMLLGLLVYVVSLVLMNGDISKLNTTRYETNTHTLYGEIRDIHVELDTANICLLLAEDGVGYVECYEETNARHSVTVENGTLTIRVVNEKQWYEYIDVDWSTPEITVYLPKEEYGTLTVKGDTGSVVLPKTIRFESIDIDTDTGGVACLSSASESIRIKTSTGTIRVKEVQAETLTLSASTGLVSASSVTCRGDVTIRVGTGLTVVNNVSCQNLASVGDTGNISLNYVIVAERLSVERSTGDVCFEGADAAEIFVETDTGDVKGTLLSEKVFVVETDTGRVNVPKSVTGGRCEITTDTGDVIITIVG